MTKASDNLFPKVILNEAASDGSDFSNPSADYRVLFLGEDGSLHLKDSSGTVTDVGGATSLTQAYAGYNTIGGSWEQLTTLRVLAKKITLANNCQLSSIEAHLRNSASGSDDIVHSLAFGLYTDNAGTPQYLIHSSRNGSNSVASVLFDSASGSTGDDTGRWYGHSCGLWLTAGDYWICFQMVHSSTPSMAIAYDGSGTDRYYTSGGEWMTDWGFYSPTTGSNKYSIRANTIR